MTVFLFFVGFYFAVANCAPEQSTLTYYLNSCLGDLEIEEAEDWVGYFIEPMPQTIAPNTAANWTLSYAAIPNDHVSLDLDYGYWYNGNGTYPLLHGYVQVLAGYPNLTVRYDIYPWKQKYFIDENVGYYVCWENVTQPSFFGVWVWDKSKGDTLESCKAKTSAKPGC